MADVVIGPVIEVLAQQLTSLILKLCGLGSAGQEFKESCQVLSDVVTRLNDLKEIKFKSYELMSWYEDLKYLVEDLEEVVADLKEEIEEQRGILRRIKKVWKHDSTLKDELKAITTRIRQLYDREKILHHVETKDSLTKPGPTHADPKMFGRESEKEAIIELLKTPSSYGECVYDFISIVGMGGIGKTTLAQHVYEEGNVASFPVRAWCHASMDFNQCEIYRSIIEQQLKSGCLIRDSSAMEEKLRDVLKGKKFLIVIDDYWSESVNDFNALRAPFMAAEPGSKFIVTTRNKAVAKRFTAEERIIDLGLLSNEDCWALFCSGSRLAADSSSKLVIIGKEICEKCGGMPLAVVVMKGLLSGIDDEAGWRAVLDDMVSGKISDVRSIIKRSYWDLPEYLKQCFSFCTIFPQGHSFERRSTVNLWICAEIIKCENQSREDDLGVRWFDEIVSRSLLTRNPIGYVMHDIVRGMGVKVSGETHGRWEEKVGSWDKIRHVSISKHIIAKALDDLKCVPKEKVRLKTLIIDCENYENEDMKELYLKWKHLRVLQMQNLKVSKLSKYLGQMKHLRKLEIRNIYDLKKVSVISSLNNLRELDIMNCNNLTSSLPPSLSRLRLLKRFSIMSCKNLTGHILPELGVLTNLTHICFLECQRLTGLIPSELGGLTALDFLSFHGCERLTGPIPLELGVLTSLTHLSFFNCGGLTGTIPTELGGLTALKYLSFYLCKGLTGSIPPELGGLIALDCLSFYGCVGLIGYIPPELGNLILLEYLHLDGCIGLTGPIPPELGGLVELKCLTFYGCEGLTGTIPPELGGLILLEYLYMDSCSGLTGPIPLELGNLSSLTNLSFTGCKGLTGPVPPELGGLEALEYLFMENCSGLRETIPQELGELAALQYFNLDGCSGLTGSIPLKLGKLTKLKYFNVNGCNGLTGVIPELEGLTSVTNLSLSERRGMLQHFPNEIFLLWMWKTGVNYRIIRGSH